MPWQPGESGNRAGRPKGFRGVARLIMQETCDGAELVEWALEVWRDPSRSFGERQAAHAWLADRALGKPLQSMDLSASLEVSAGLPAGWDSLPSADRERYLDRLIAGELPSGSDG